MVFFWCVSLRVHMFLLKEPGLGFRIQANFVTFHCNKLHQQITSTKTPFPNRVIVSDFGRHRFFFGVGQILFNLVKLN
jgi:hypothetical protein